MLHSHRAPRSPGLTVLLSQLFTCMTFCTACGSDWLAPRLTPTPVFTQTLFRDGIETGSDVPDDGDRPGQPEQWFIEPSDAQKADGQRSAKFFLDGKHDDGTIWLARAFELPPNQSFEVQVSFYVWSESESINTLAKVAASAGGGPPVEEESFDAAHAANQVAADKHYSYAFDVSSDSRGRVWEAPGISVVWETQVTYYIDSVVVEIRPSLE